MYRIVSHPVASTALAQDVSTRVARNVCELLRHRVLDVTAVDQCSMQTTRGLGMGLSLMTRLNNQPLGVRALLGIGCLITVATALSAPGEADPSDDNFIDALSHAGIEYGEPGNAMAVGQSLCPMLAQPGGSFAAAASSVARRGMSPRMAQQFTTIAVQTYCPTEIANINNGNVSGLPQVPGVTGIPGT
jgi:hypothetical protein